MMKKTGILLAVLFAGLFANAQKYYTKSGKISFYSATSMENIEAINKSASAVVDSKSGDIQFALLMKGFEFKKALMQEHFNTDYVESTKYPKGEFKGQITNNSDINYGVDGNYTAKVKGILTVHGQPKQIETTGTITVQNGSIHLKSVFNVQVADFKITVPKLYRDNISSSIKVTVDCKLDALK
jgi:hypothetical protein